LRTPWNSYDVFASPIVEGARVFGTETEPRDYSPHPAPFPNSMLPILSGLGIGVALVQPDFPDFGLTKQSLMNGRYQPEASIQPNFPDDRFWPKADARKAAFFPMPYPPRTLLQSNQYPHR
jgi:hypothetical protein